MKQPDQDLIANDAAQPMSARAEARWWHNKYLHLALILCVGGVIYAGIMSAPFVYDDFTFILLNPAIDNFRYITDTSNLKELLLNEDVYKNIVLRPVGYFTFAMNRYLDGFDVFGYHLFNVFVHLASALLVYLITRLTLSTQIVKVENNAEPPPGITSLMPLFGALLFVSHPLQTQSVTYITQRFTSLAAFFFLLSLALYIKSGLSQARMPRYSYYAGALIVACTAMKTKEIAFTLPAIIVVYEWLFFNNKLKLRFVKLVPFVLTMLIIPLTVMKLNALFSHTQVAAAGKLNLVNYAGISKWDYLFSQFSVIVTYIRLLLLPINQKLDYFIPVHSSFFQFQVVGPFTLIATIIGCGVYLLQRSKTAAEPYRTRLRLIAFGIIWFFITLSVESSLIPLDDLLVEQRVYLPSVGFILACMASVAILFEKQQRSGASLFAGLFSLCVIALSVATYSRNSLWMDPIALWSDTARKSPQRARAFQNLGAHYFGKRMFRECVNSFTTAQLLEPDKIEPTVNLANVYLALNRFDEAEAEYLKAMKLHPDNERLYNSLAKLYIIRNQHGKALPLLQYLVRVNPYSPDVHTKLAELYEATGQHELAIAEYMSVMRLVPNDSVILNRIKLLTEG